IFSHSLGLLSTFYSLGCSGRLSCLHPLNTPKHRMSFAFEKLLISQESVDLADLISATTEEFQRG
ncbi:MAG: hypothetical protein ACK48K_22465, partial [Planctomycetota bacterium]